MTSQACAGFGRRGEVVGWLFTALAWADVLLTLDKADFSEMLGGTFYGLSVQLPYDFLDRERSAGRLTIKK
jgi:hypothetical protein